MSLQKVCNVIHIETTNQLSDMVEMVEEIGRPVLSVRLSDMEYLRSYMKEIGDDWCYYISNGILIIAQLGREESVEFFCINTNLIDIGFMRDISQQGIYGENRSYALHNIVGIVQDYTLRSSFDEESLHKRVEEFEESSSNAKFIRSDNGSYIYAAHIVHNGVNSSGAIVVSRNGGLYCNYVCIPDSIVDSVIDIANGITDK